MKGDKRLMKKPKWPKESYLMVSRYAVTHLSNPALVLLMFLVEESRPNGLVQIKMADISKQTELPESKVKRAAKELEDGHWLHSWRTQGAKYYNINPAKPHVRKPDNSGSCKNYTKGGCKNAPSGIIDFPGGSCKSAPSFSTTVQVHDNGTQSGLIPEECEDPPFIPDHER